MDRIVVALGLVLSIVTTGCGASLSGAARRPRAVEPLVTAENGGILELHGSIVSSTARAHVVMTEHCEGRWRLLEGAEALALQAAAAVGKSQDEIVPIAIDDRHLAYECVSR